MKKIVLLSMISMMVFLCGCGDIRYLDKKGNEYYINVPSRLDGMIGYSWEGNKLIIEFAEDE